MRRLPAEWIVRATRFATRIDLYNFGRWLVLAMLIGVVAGLGAALLTWGVGALSGLLHVNLAGFVAPGHGAVGSPSWQLPERPWVLLLVLPLAGLLVGFIVQTFAPEAEGHGTDAVIAAYHRGGAQLRKRIVPIKLLASITCAPSCRARSFARRVPPSTAPRGYARLT